MSDSILNAETVKNWFNAADDETGGQFLEDIQYSEIGQVLEVPGVTDYQFTIVDTKIDREYDSYGYSSIDGYIVFSAAGLDGSESKLFKLPYSYQSFGGDEWDINNISETEKRKTIISTWENI
jgi:hypothetical protein